MKYDINTPYEFEVKDVINDNNTLFFQIVISGNLFPVKAYSEQIEENIPKSISCRIMLDNNQNAYLVQNESFLYPYLYKEGKRYLFEVVDIKDSYVVVQDKHGLHHAMPKDGTKLSINEIIVRNVKIIEDALCKAHLQFTYVEVPIVLPREKHISDSQKVVESIVTPQYAPTIFEEDAPSPINKNIGLNFTQPIAKENNNATEPNSIKSVQTLSNETVASLILSKDWNHLKSYLDKNFDKAKVVTIQKEIIKAFQSFTTGTQYWETVKFLITYDARKILATISKIDVSHLPDISNSIDSCTLNEIVKAAFAISDKLKFAVDIISLCADHLTLKQKNYIASKCVDINSPSTFYSLFKVLKWTPNDAVPYLLSLKDNIAAAFTMYKLYLNGKMGNQLEESSRIEAFRPSFIIKHVEQMMKMQSYPFMVSAQLIKYNIFSRGECPVILINEVKNKGFAGFDKFVQKNQQKNEYKKIQQQVDDLAVGDPLNNLSYLKDSDNYHILYHNQLGVYALLDKRLTFNIPNKETQAKGKIVKILTWKNQKYFIIAQKKRPSMYIFPPLVDFAKPLRISFSKGNDGSYIPKVKQYSKLISARIESYPPSFDYKLIYEAKIIRKIDFFTYIVKIINHK